MAKLSFSGTRPAKGFSCSPETAQSHGSAHSRCTISVFKEPTDTPRQVSKQTTVGVRTSRSKEFLPSSSPIGMLCFRGLSGRFPCRGRVSRHEYTGLSPPGIGQAVVSCNGARSILLTSWLLPLALLCLLPTSLQAGCASLSLSGREGRPNLMVMSNFVSIVLFRDTQQSQNQTLHDKNIHTYEVQGVSLSPAGILPSCANDCAQTSPPQHCLPFLLQVPNCTSSPACPGVSRDPFLHRIAEASNVIRTPVECCIDRTVVGALKGAILGLLRLEGKHL